MKLEQIEKANGKLVNHNNDNKIVFVPKKWINILEMKNNLIEKNLVKDENGKFHLLISSK